MSLNIIAYIAFSLGIIFFFCTLYYFSLKLRRELVEELLAFKKSLFQLTKELYFLTQKKEIHDTKLKSFVAELKVPEGKKLSSKNLNDHFVVEEVKFNNLLAKEEFFYLCKERVVELAFDLKTRYSKSIMFATKLLGLGSPKNREKGVIGRLLSKEDPTWEIRVQELWEQANNLKGNKNLLIHSFLSFERELKQKLLNVSIKEED